eukprot:GHVN01071402.1.p1 GENE.GHVN01071402.1~~GHVN01071402.1.p1  ORF type:complete len:137 (+),score=5.05 GHVN01071402.1:1016-1426(+)
MAMETCTNTPKYKNKGSYAQPSSYRPIICVSNISKLLERIIVDHVLIHLTNILTFSKSQHGALPFYSTLTNLPLTFNHYYKQHQDGGHIIAIFLDFEKAFDKVDHHILLSKLQTLGIGGQLLRWITSWLFNRTFCG